MTKEKFEAELIQFVNERKEQKLRGLNNYNVMTAIRHADAEVGMHSNFIYSLINPDGDHYQGTLFADLFVKNVLAIDDFGKITEVVMEDDADGRRIDFVIKSGKYSIGIEMKTRAETQDQHSQIYDYHTELMKDGKGEKNTIIYYLTLNGKEPSKASYCDKNNPNKIYKDYKKVSFKNEMLLWLEECKKQVGNITNLNNAIEYYIDVVKMITGQYRSPLNRFEDFFLDKDKGKERFSSMKSMSVKEILKIMNSEKSILSEKEARQETENIIKDCNEAQQKLYDQFYEKLFTHMLKDEDLILCRYIQNKSAQEVQFVMNEYYCIVLCLNKQHNKIINIKVGIAWAYYNEAKGNPVLKKLLQEKGSIISKTQKLESYTKGKGKSLDNAVIPEPTNENIFNDNMLDKNTIVVLDKNISDIKKHLPYY